LIRPTKRSTRSPKENVMPKNSKVDRVYQALKREGYDKASAAKISQSQTGQALATGKPPKHKGKK
jgi:hypothetical protein